MERVIRPRKVYQIDWAELWRYRELFVTMVMRQLIVRYKQTLIGVVWALIRPLLTMVIFTLIFGYLAGFKDKIEHYPVLVFTATLPWFLFAQGLTQSTQSVLNNAGMVGKIYFPRLILPTSACLCGLVDFLISLVLLFGMMAWYGIFPTWRIACLPLLVALALFSALGPSLWLSALNVKYRDVVHIVPFLVQLGFYVTPVGYSASVIPESWRYLYWLNPMVSVVEGFRWALLGGDNVIMPGPMAISCAMVLLIFATGLLYFRHQEKSFADYI